MQRPPQGWRASDLPSSFDDFSLRYPTLLLTIPLRHSTVDDYDAAAAAEKKRARSFRKFSYRGVELDALLDMSNEEFMKIVHARVRRRFQRGLKRKPMGLIKKLRKAKAEAPPNEKPTPVKTHLRGECDAYETEIWKRSAVTD